ncbi:MAG: hypothetical protein PHW63_04255 [Alphaproteobacteria bacterium]|nr:hypothetical protein [Alphaproteobacteria bacterium]
MFNKALSVARTMTRAAYVEPFRNRDRTKTLLIGFAANLGYGCLSFMLNYNLAGYGLLASLSHQVMRPLFMGYLFVPLTFLFYTRVKSRVLLALLQIAAIGLFFIDTSNGTLNAFALAFVFSPFLAMHNYNYGKNTSRSNRGNEAALYAYSIIIAYSGGLFLGGLCLEQGWYNQAIVIGSLCTIAGSFFLYRPIAGRNNGAKVKSLLGWRKPSTRISFFSGLMNPLLETCMPAWMRMIGLPALAAGISMSLRPIIGLFLTPFAGWLVQKKGFKAGQLGGTALIVGWILVGVSSFLPWLLSFSLALLNTGKGLISPLEIGRWQRRRSSAAVISREIAVATGRIPSNLLGVAITFLAPALYPVLGLGFTGLFIWGSIPRRRKQARV